jgi:hypothetical protein
VEAKRIRVEIEQIIVEEADRLSVSSPQCG